MVGLCSGLEQYDMHRVLIVVLLFTFLSSCSRSDSVRPNHSFNMTMENGVAFAETSGGPKFPGEIFSYEKIVEIRGNPSDDRSFLVYPYPPTIDSDGFLYIADTRGHRIVVFSLEGEFIRTFGQAGEGPDDIIMPTTIRIYGDTLNVTSNWTTRGIRQRISKFTKSGAFLEVYIETLEEALYPHIYDVARDGRRIGVYWDSLEEDGTEYEYITASVIRGIDDTTAVVRSPAFEKGRRITLKTSTGTREGVTDYLFQARPQIWLSPPETVVVSAGFEGKLYHYSLDGILTRIIHLNMPPEPVTQADQDSLKARYNAMIEHLQQDELNPDASLQIRDLRNRRENLLFPEHKAFWTWTYLDDSGFSWLRKPVERPYSNTRNDHDIYQIISPEGQYLGDTEWPGVKDARVMKGYLLAIVVDQETHERVPTVFRINSVLPQMIYP